MNDAVMYILAFLVGLVLKDFLPSYSKKKGENLATKEDIAAITAEVKNVEALFNKELEGTKNYYQMKMAAIETRLAAHQSAFTHWYKIVRSSKEEDKRELCRLAGEWWSENCIYLHPKVKDEFTVFINLVSASSRDVGHPLMDWDRWFVLPNLIFAEVSLPPLSDEQKTIVKEKPDE